MNKIATILSLVFSPLLVPTYGVALALWVSALSSVPVSVRFGVVAVTFIITGVVPLLAIAGMWRLGLVKDPGVNERTERTVPYIITAASYLACTVYLFKANAPLWLVGFLAGAFVAALISLAVNCRWKISAHMAAMGGLVAIAFRLAVSDYAIVDMLWVIVAVVLAAGLVGTARIGMHRHTIWQVVAGAANGFVCVMLLSMF